MTMTVRDRGEALATFRYVQVFLMETLARWVPTTPEMEVKVLFGRHVWDMARHADALGRRVHELRLPPQHSLRPADGYVAFLEEIARGQATRERLDAVYEVALPALRTRYVDYLARTDALLDEPSVRVIEAILHDHERIAREAAGLFSALPELPAADAQRCARLRELERVPRMTVPLAAGAA